MKMCFKIKQNSKNIKTVVEKSKCIGNKITGVLIIERMRRFNKM